MPISPPSLLARIEALPDLVNADADLVRRGRYVDADWLLEAGDVVRHVATREGRIVHMEAGPILLRAWRFAIRGSADGFMGHWEALPKPWFHDVSAMMKKGLVRFEGDLHPFMCNLQYFKDVLAAPRRLTGRS